MTPNNPENVEFAHREIDAMAKIVEVLRPFDPEQRRRILRSVIILLDMEHLLDPPPHDSRRPR